MSSHLVVVLYSVAGVLMAEKKEKHDRIKSLKCYTMVREYLVAGYPATSLARIIQKEKRESTDIEFESLVNALKLYRADICPADKLIPRLPHIVMDAEKQFTDKLEELKRLEAILDANMWRFDLLHAKERMTDVVNEELDKVQNNVIKIIGKMHEIKMDLGLSGSRELGTLTVSTDKLEEVEKEYGEGAARALADPVKRNRVFAVIKAAEEEARAKEAERAQNRDKSQ